MKQSVRPFSEQGHYTEAHNLIFDYIMPRVSANAFKVLCLILRHTKGWGKSSDAIAYTQIKEGTGIGSDTTISEKIKELVTFGCIVLKSKGRTNETNTYALNLKFEVPISEIYQNSTPENGEQKTQKDTPKNGERRGVGTPENGVSSTPENGEQRTPKNGDTKENNKTSTNQNNKLGVVDKGEQKKSAASPEEIQSAVLEVLGEEINFLMGAFSSNNKTLLNSFVRAAVRQGRTADDVRVWRERLPHYLRADPKTFTTPTLNQLVSTFGRVLEFQPKAKTSTVPTAAERRAITEKYKNRSRGNNRE